jgi:signal transduction histidine kinase
MLARLRALPPFRADLLLAGAFLAEALLEILVIVPDGATRQPEAVGMALALAVALALRRISPAGAALGGIPFFLLYNQLGEDYINALVSPFFAVLLLLYGVGRHLEGRTAHLLTAYGVAIFMISSAIDHFDDSALNFVISGLAIVCGPVLIGRVLRNRARLHQTLREKAVQLERERTQRAAAAANLERERIAGELHDVIAHALSAMVVQASGARRLAGKDAARAGEAFGAIETSGREALTEIRGLLGVLRREDEELALAPQPSLRHVDSLVRRVRAAGLPVVLDVDGEARELPIGVDLTAYRVVQEALGEALEHGHAGRASVRLSYGTDSLELEVGDDGAGSDRSLLGIRERVAVSGGQLRAGARRDGGHVVRARLPLGGPA